MDIALLLSGFLVFCIGAIGMIMPRIIRLSKRWHAVGLSMIGFVIFALGTDIAPPESGVEPVDGMVAFSVGLAALITLSAYAITRGFEAFNNKRSTQSAASIDEAPPAPTLPIEQPPPPLTPKERAKRAKEFQELALKYRQPRDEPKAEAISAQKNQAPEISLNDLQYGVRTLEDAEAREAARRQKFYEEDMRLARELGGPKPERPPKIKYDPAKPKQRRGRWIDFRYCDYHGSITERKVENWFINGPYLEGDCTDADAERTFRLDRVLTWYGWK